MLKALAILNSMRELELKNGLNTSGVDVAIVELEEVIKYKECDLCIHLLPKSRICMKRVQLHDGSLPSNFYCSEYKPKDT